MLLALIISLDPCSAANPKLDGFHFLTSTPWRLSLVNLNLTSPSNTFQTRRSHQPRLASAILFRKVPTCPMALSLLHSRDSPSHLPHRHPLAALYIDVSNVTTSSQVTPFSLSPHRVSLFRVKYSRTPPPHPIPPMLSELHHRDVDVGGLYNTCSGSPQNSLSFSTLLDKLEVPPSSFLTPSFHSFIFSSYYSCLNRFPGGTFLDLLPHGSSRGSSINNS